MPQFVHNSLFATAIGCAVGCFLFSNSASAQTETFVANSYLKSATLNTDFVLPSFNTSLGTLDGVDLTLQFNLCPIVSVYNSTSSSIGFTNASIDVPLNVTGPGTFDYGIDLSGTVASGTAKPGLTTDSLARVKTFGYDQIAASSLDLWENQPGEKVTLDAVTSFPTFQGTAKGNGLFFGGSATEWGQITVEYIYTPSSLATPEPRGAYLTAIVGLAMIVAVLRRRRPYEI